MDRRTFVKAGAATVASLATGGCAPLLGARPTSGRPRANLYPVDVSWERVIRTTVGLRPHRESGFRLEAERLDDKTVIHNYGHGGAGMSLSWGTGSLAAELALGHPERRAAVVGCGIVGLTAARQLQRRGFDVTIYAKSLPPDTTSNVSWAGFTPASGLVTRRTPAWDTQFRRAVEIAYREHQLLVGRDYGVAWIDSFGPTDNPGGGGQGGGPADGGGRGGGDAGVPPGGARAGGGDDAEGYATAPGPLLPSGVEVGSILLQPGEHPFPTRYARYSPTMGFEPSIYLEALMRDVLAFGGKIEVRSFDTPQDLMALPEPLIVNCTGLGARQLFGDEEMTPIKGQLTVLVPQPEVTYSLGGMMPRSDGIVLGHVQQRGVWSLEVDEEEVNRVMENAFRMFGAMRPPRGDAPAARLAMSSEPPPVESFFGLQS